MPKKLFSKEDYFKLLDNALNPPLAVSGLNVQGELLQKMREAIQGRKQGVARLPKIQS